ncbi:MAG TPA: response regulator [Longimicrobiales bacterium]|nr:response regulator [Longimicrobiales bacterium]
MSRRVLVADDEPLTAEMLALMLAFRGFEVSCAHDGADALRQARTWKPDVILLDVMMPELEGVDVTRVLRSDDAFRDRPVILISSCDECEVEWREAGANVFLQKPIDILALPDLVERLLPGDEPPPQRRSIAA